MDENTLKKPAGRFQYSLKGVLLFTTWLAVFCGLALLHVALSAIFLVLSAFIVAVVSGRWLFALPAILCLAALALALVPTGRSLSRAIGESATCSWHLREISYALIAYEIQHGSFPPAYIADKNGKPMHSWRVLILPYLDRQDLYDAYNFDEPWDGPNNRKLADKCPILFRCPSDEAAGSPSQNTSYVAIVGPHTAWTGKNGLTRYDFPDRMSETLVVVETADSGINWMEPRDLYVGQMARTVNAKAGQGISSKHAGGFHAAFADGSRRNLSEDLPPETLDALITRDGGETVDPDAL